MSSNKLVLSVLMSLTFFSLTACKQGGGDTKRTQIRKGNATPAQTKAAKEAADAKKQEELKKKREAGGTGTDTPDNKDDKTQTTARQTATCAELESAAKEYGWKILSVDVKDAAKTKITYYVLENSIDKFSNPVIYFNRNAFQYMKPTDLKTFKEHYDKYKIDPILMDMRGAGCSSALPDLKTKTSELNNYGAKQAVLDAELVRKAVLKDKTWKVLAHKTGGMVALKYVQYAPTGLQSQSINIADFAPMKSQSELMKIRLKQEAKSWKALMDDNKLTQEDVDKALKNLGDDKELIHALSLDLSYRDRWTAIANDVKALAEGTKKASSLKEIVTKLKTKSDLYTASRLLDIDNTKNLSACADALKIETEAVVNSCKLEKLVGHGEISTIKNVVNHDALNAATVKVNLAKYKITYNLYQARLSTQYPPDSYLEHEEDMDIRDTTVLLEKIGSDIYLSEEFLNKLR